MRATYFNVGKATLGTIPFVYYGAELYGAEGVLIGQAIGVTIFGALAALVCLRTVSKLNDECILRAEREETQLNARTPLNPYSSARTFNWPTYEIGNKNQSNN